MTQYCQWRLEVGVQASSDPSQLPERLIKASEVAKVLNVSRAFAYQLMQKGLIPTVKILGARRVRPEDLHRFIQENTSK